VERLARAATTNAARRPDGEAGVAAAAAGSSSPRSLRRCQPDQVPRDCLNSRAARREYPWRQGDCRGWCGRLQGRAARAARCVQHRTVPGFPLALLQRRPNPPSNCPGSRASFGGMGRPRRPNLPGRAFHIVTRTQGHADLFTPALRWTVLRLLRRYLLRSDARLLAFAVMPNHLHLVLIQGQQPLWRLMQPFLRAVALAVHAVHGGEGHVFERRYRDRICRDARHVIRAIAYVHANPVRAGLCTHPRDYPWTSYRAYVRARRAGVPPLVAVRLLLLGERRDGEDSPPRPAAARQTLLNSGNGQRRCDAALEQLAIDVARKVAPAIHIDEIRSRHGRRDLVLVRRAIALAASAAGYTSAEIGQVLARSDSAVSRLLTREPTV
jgi:putative transposase